MINSPKNDTNDPVNLTCYRHPDRETQLRCNKCDRPICSSCAVRTPTGYRCPDCIREMEKKFDTAQFSDYVFSCLLSAAIAYGGSYISRFLGFFTLLIAPVISMLISEGVLKVTHGRSSTMLSRLVLMSAIVGSLPLLLIGLYQVAAFLSFYGGLSGVGSVLPLLWQVGYTLIMATTLRARIKGLYLG